MTDGQSGSYVEVVCSLPLVVPPIAFVAGIGTVLKWGPEYLSRTPLFETFVAIQNPGFPFVLVLAYVVMALPFVYRALDSGLRAIDVRTLVEAARSCGASWPQALVGAVLPNLRRALLNASFLTLALVLGEFTVAQLLGFQPFAVWIVSVSGSQAQLSVAVSVLSVSDELRFSWVGLGFRPAPRWLFSSVMSALPSASRLCRVPVGRAPETHLDRRSRPGQRPQRQRIDGEAPRMAAFTSADRGKPETIKAQWRSSGLALCP
ncbi:transmembrane component of thiamin ABC transporter [Streptomyces sp. NL15-2K]|nr:ABC transporter permease subunit [Kutzneria buriramensis]WKX07171.1 ABC transporter permease subunit [Kutzneria buriramensis]GCB51633.1 transmembrane component of thiamin ABC transporter [Streptomyces sp. NL15-2K]